MSGLRRHARVWAIIWFVCQVVSLAALLPRDCCVSHRPVVKALATPSCHESQTAAAMHEHQRPPRRSSRDCTMRGTCEGPQLVAVFSYPGIPVAAVADWFFDASLPSFVALREDPSSRSLPPDPPPPRA